MVYPEPLVQVEEFNKHAGLKKSTLLWMASLTEMVNASFQFPSTHQSSLVTYSILFMLTFHNGPMDRCKKVHFQQTDNKGLRQLFLTVSWDA